jgi:nucleoid DNA-binding protein
MPENAKQHIPGYIARRGKPIPHKVEATQLQLIDTVCEMIGALPKDWLRAKAIVKDFFDVMIEGIARDSEVRIKNFGIFWVGHKRARRVRNYDPRTDSQVEFAAIPAHNHVYFRPSPILTDKVNNRPHLTYAQRRPYKKYPKKLKSGIGGNISTELHGGFND